MQQWPLHQLDVKIAFLNGNLSNIVFFMKQPIGFIDDQFALHVYWLNKALHGLKQAPHAWFRRLSAFLISLGFLCSPADTSLSIFHWSVTLLYLLVYVDNIILTGNDPTQIHTFITRMNNVYAMKDLGRLNYFLGLEDTYTSDDLFLTQAKYAHDILTHVGLLESKWTAAHLSIAEHLFTTSP